MSTASKSSAWIRRAVDRGYAVDDEGRMYGPSGQPLRLLARRYSRMVYWSFSTKPGKIKVHRFVAYLKFGIRALRKGVHVRHADGNSMNCAWDNIILGNQSQNELDKPEHVRRAVLDRARAIWLERRKRA